MYSLDVVESVVRKVLSRIESLGYQGYDPADASNSPLFRSNKLSSKRLRRLITVLNAYSPINLRPMLKIEPAFNTTAMCLFASTYLNLYLIEQQNSWLEKGENLLDWLLEHSISEADSLGWSRILPYEASWGFHEVKPLTFLNAKVGDTFFRYYKVTGDSEYLDISIKACNGLLKYPKFYYEVDGLCLSYTTQGSAKILNASALAAALLAKVGKEISNSAFLEVSRKAIKYIISKQNNDGSWYYGYLDNGKVKKQIDFHQSYNIDALLDLYCMDLLDKGNYSVLLKGVEFYRHNLFSENGISLWRFPYRWPIDIHNQSHGILEFSRLSIINQEYLLFAERLIDWTLSNFYDDRGFFYFQKWFNFTIKHDFFRWNTAWMVFALSEYVLFSTRKSLVFCGRSAEQYEGP